MRSRRQAKGCLLVAERRANASLLLVANTLYGFTSSGFRSSVRGTYYRTAVVVRTVLDRSCITISGI